MPYLPDLPEVQGTHNPAAPSLAGASAAGRAMMGAGKDISAIGDDLGAAQQRFQAARDNGIRNQTKLLMQQAYDEHQQYRAENPDESTWETDMKARIGGVREAIGKEKMSPFLKTELDAEFSGWEQSNASAVKLDATKQGFQRARQRTTNAVRAYAEAGDYASARKVLEASKGNEFLPEEADQDLLELDRTEKIYQEKEKDKAARNEIAADPDGWLKANPADKIPEGTDAYEFRARRSYALGLYGQQQQEIQDVVRESIIEGKITSEAEIDSHTEDALPSVRAGLKKALFAKTDAAEQRRMGSDEYKNRLVGEVSKALNNFDREDIATQLKLDELIHTLPEGATRSYLQSELSKAIKGEDGEPDTALSVNLKLADSAFKGGFFGRLPQKQTIGSMVSDGLLKDKRKLWNLGLGSTDDKESDAYKIATAKDDAERKKLFGQLWKEAKAKDAPPYLKAAAAAIRDGHGNTHEVSYTDPAENLRALDLYGTVKTETIRWAKQNPKATVDEIRTHMLKVAAPGVADAFIESALGVEDLDDSVLPPLESDSELEIILPPLNN